MANVVLRNEKEFNEIKNNCIELLRKYVEEDCIDSYEKHLNRLAELNDFKFDFGIEGRSNFCLGKWDLGVDETTGKTYFVKTN